MLLTNKNYGEKAQGKFTVVAHYQNYVIAINEENIEAKKMAVAAIRKQIPQRPVDKKASTKRQYRYNPGNMEGMGRRISS